MVVTTWKQPDGRAVSCEEKIKVLNENLEEIRQACQDAFEDALLMGCDADQIRKVFAAVVETLHDPYETRDGPRAGASDQG